MKLLMANVPILVLYDLHCVLDTASCSRLRSSVRLQAPSHIFDHSAMPAHDFYLILLSK